MDTIWIDQPDQLSDFCTQIAGEPIAVDTESDHFHAYQAQVCLIQVGAPGVGALVDPLALDAQQLEPLFDLLGDPQVVTILHSARNDIRELDRDYGVSIANVFDTQIAAKFLGYERNSLAWLQEEIVGEKRSGRFSRFDWTTRPIPDDARAYAVADIADLFALRQRFRDELADSGWLEPFRQQCAYVATISGYTPSPFDPERWWRLESRYDLDTAGRTALRELYVCRHEICEAENRAAVHIFPNKALAKVAERRPASLAELHEIRRLSEDFVARHGERILAAIEGSLQAEPPPSERPRKPRSRRPAAQQERYDALRDWRNRTAEAMDIDGAFIATNATLSEIAADPPDTVKGLDAFEAILPWHRQMLGDEILEVLKQV